MMNTTLNEMTTRHLRFCAVVAGIRDKGHDWSDFPEENSAWIVGQLTIIGNDDKRKVYQAAEKSLGLRIKDFAGLGDTGSDIDDAESQVEDKVVPPAKASKASKKSSKASTSIGDVGKLSPITQAIVRELEQHGVKLGGGAASEDVEAMVKKAVDNLSLYRGVEIKTPKAAVKIEGHVHPEFDKVLKLVNANLFPMLIGPTGCGKTHMAGQVAKAIGARKYVTTSCTAGTSESEVKGWLLPIGKDGNYVHVPTEVLDVIENGGLWLMDEIDGCDPNMLVFLNSLLSNGYVNIPQRYEKPMVTAHADFRLIAAANTYGNGADAMYVGRNQLDAATLDRFYRMYMDYDRKLEATLAPKHIVTWCHKVRDVIAEGRMRRIMGTRRIIHARDAEAAGIHWDVIKADFVSDWTADEKRKLPTL